MKIDLTEADVRKVAGNSLRKKANAEKFLQQHGRQILNEMKVVLEEVLSNWVLDEEIDDDQVEDDEDDEEGDGE